MDDECINTWHTIQDYTVHAQSGINSHQHAAYLEAVNDTACAQQPGAALQYNHAGNHTITTRSCAIHATHCTRSEWHTHQEIAYLQHYDLMSLHYTCNSATPEMLEIAVRDHCTQ